MSAPKVKLIVDAAGRGSLTLDGVELVSCTGVQITVTLGRASYVKFEMLAHIECEIAPGRIEAVITEVAP